ncbi:WD40-repeat-containing domain protein [Catenaria anguillulae PL171]|uniref:WD40-repeat-containing domain protein n=1 Tax=Catenaria anguillulae PL171 TaxID=765915 RepID=A0A1Y2HYN2_9FUNG|nr:WD40-repeat-containing domain protein [Catenaria anguillulae PL171]
MAAPDTSSPADILDEPVSQRAKLLSKYHSEYALVQTLPTAATAAPTQTRPAAQQQKQRQLAITSGSATPSASSSSAPSASTAGSTNALAVIPKPTTAQQQQQPFSNALVPLGQTRDIPPPQWHAPWKLFRVIAGHTGWVRSVAVDPSNEWFVTGGGDRLIKIWDMASGNLKLTLTGHISAVRGLAVSERHPYLFSAGEDKQLKNWDLETNKVIRQYHGHLSGIYSLALHPTLDILATGGRDSTIRLWDMRSKHQIHVLTGHQATIGTIFMQPSEFQLVSGSNDSTIKLWDIRAGKSMGTLTHHKKSVRALCAHPTESTFVSGSPDNIKQWVMTKEGLDASAEFPTVKFVQNFSGHQGIVNCLAANDEGVLFSGGDNGSMHFWDWRTGYNFQSMVSPVQPGSLESEAGIFAATFDRSGYRLITCEADKSIKMWKEDERASKDSHPIVWRPDLVRTRY